MVWGESLCDLCRYRLGELFFERELLCVPCADIVLERLVLVENVRAELPPARASELLRNLASLETIAREELAAA